MIYNSVSPFSFLRNMTTIDIVIFIIIGAGAILGFMKGFLKQSASIAGLIVGLIAAKMLYLSLAEKLCLLVTDSINIAKVIAFIMIWIAVPLIFILVASVFTKAMEAVSLGCINRWLGAVLGVVKYFILVSLIINVIEFIDTDNHLISKTNKESSALYYPVGKFVGILFPTIKEVTKNYI